MSDPVIYITGATASGKSALAMRLANTLGGEMISENFSMATDLVLLFLFFIEISIDILALVTFSCQTVYVCVFVCVCRISVCLVYIYIYICVYTVSE